MKIRADDIKPIAVVAGVLALPFFIRTVAGGGGDFTKINVEVYTGKTCSQIRQTPTDDDPTNTHMFTYDVVWEYTEGEAGKLPYRTEKGRVATTWASRNSTAYVNLTAPLEPLPADVRNDLAAQGWTGGPLDWTEQKCIPFQCDDRNINKGCCLFPYGIGKIGEPTVIQKSLIYRVLEDKCLDCHYVSCQPEGHTVPKGGGFPMVFKYSYVPDDCAQMTGCPKDPSGGCMYRDEYGQYRGKCYIIIR